jgi:hypothetical protein
MTAVELESQIMVDNWGTGNANVDADQHRGLML